jgi:hypothetical protein
LTQRILFTVEVGFSQDILDAQMRQWWSKALKIAFAFLIVLGITLVSAVHLIVAKPLKYLGAIGERIPEGDIIHTVKLAKQADSHGREFAVIADEMRSLATKVSASTKDIAAIVQTVQKKPRPSSRKFIRELLILNRVSHGPSRHDRCWEKSLRVPSNHQTLSLQL